MDVVYSVCLDVVFAQKNVYLTVICFTPNEASNCHFSLLIVWVMLMAFFAGSTHYDVTTNDPLGKYKALFVARSAALSLWTCSTVSD